MKTSNELNELKSMLIEIQEQLTKLTRELENELLTPDKVCRILKIGKTTYQNYLKKEVFQQINIVEGRTTKVYVKRSEIEKLIENGKV